MKNIKLRAFIAKQKQFAIQGEPDLETIQSFMFHYGDNELDISTGIIDKNGVEIFTNDIIIDFEIDENNIDISSYYKVEYVKELASFCINNAYDKRNTSYVNIIDYIGLENLEVKGNIYQNAELLNY